MVVCTLFKLIKLFQNGLLKYTYIYTHNLYIYIYIFIKIAVNNKNAYLIYKDISMR